RENAARLQFYCPRNLKSRHPDETVAALRIRFARQIRLNENGKDSVDVRIVF
ncbi:MAG: hypothetical protein QOF80_965, partial [Verrucomicrobiota bacterium]